MRSFRAPGKGFLYQQLFGRDIWAGEHRLKNGWTIGIRADVSEVTETRRALEESEDRLKDAINSIPDSFALFDSDERLRVCNQAFLETMRRYHNNPIGQKAEDLLMAVARSGEVSDARGREDEWVQSRMEAFRDPREPFELELDDGTWVRISESRTREGGIVALRSDITEQKRQEQHLLHSQRMEVVGQLTGGVAHDFNNLLAVIFGNLGLVQDKLEEGSGTAKLVASALRAAERGADLISHLLAFSRQQNLQPVEININHQLSGMADLLEHALGESVVIKLSPGENLWATIVDPAQLESAVLNLAINARDAMPRGGNIVLTTRNIPRDELEGFSKEIPSGDYVCLDVTDEGTGIDPENLSRVLEPFFTTKDIGKGSGLGLSMVYGFARQSGGGVAIASEPGQGTTVSLLLPGVKVASRQEEASEDNTIPAPVEGVRILAIEDDPDVRDIVDMLLDHMGYQVIIAETGEHALEILEGDDRFDLVLSDVILGPGMTGPETVSLIREQKPDMPYLFMSGYADPETLAEISGEGERLLVRKPFSASELARKIETALGNRTG